MTSARRGPCGSKSNCCCSLGHTPSLSHERRWPYVLEFGDNFHGERSGGATDAVQWWIEFEFFVGDSVEKSKEDGWNDVKLGNFVP